MQGEKKSKKQTKNQRSVANIKCSNKCIIGILEEDMLEDKWLICFKKYD